MKEIIYNSLPDSMILKGKQTWHLIRLKIKKNHLWESERKKLNLISNLGNEQILLAGYPKCGNTWVRFLIFNYFNICYAGADRTLSYSELDEIYQKDSIGLPLEKKEDQNPIQGPYKNFPHIIRTHSHFKRNYKVFNKIIYVSRHPLDALVSGYHFFISDRDRNSNVNYPLNSIDSYVLFKLPLFLYHTESYLDNDHIISVTYNQLKNNPSYHLKRILNYIGIEHPDPEAIDKSVDLSSFNSIKQMGREKGETQGVARNGAYKGEFTRKGKVGGYRDELKEETILEAKKVIDRFNTKKIEFLDEYTF